MTALGGLLTWVGRITSAVILLAALVVLGALVWGWVYDRRERKAEVRAVERSLRVVGAELNARRPGLLHRPEDCLLCKAADDHLTDLYGEGT